MCIRDRLLALPLALEVKHDPIVGLARLMGAGGVGEEGGKRPRAAAGVQNRQPRLAFRVEAFGGDGVQVAGGGLAAVLGVHVEQHSNRRLGRIALCSPIRRTFFFGQALPGAALGGIAQHTRQRRLHSAHALFAEALDLVQPAIMGRLL